MTVHIILFLKYEYLLLSYLLSFDISPLLEKWPLKIIKPNPKIFTVVVVKIAYITESDINPLSINISGHIILDNPFKITIIKTAIR